MYSVVQAGFAGNTCAWLLAVCTAMVPARRHASPGRGACPFLGAEARSGRGWVWARTPPETRPAVEPPAAPTRGLGPRACSARCGGLIGVEFKRALLHHSLEEGMSAHRKVGRCLNWAAVGLMLPGIVDSPRYRRAAVYWPLAVKPAGGQRGVSLLCASHAHILCIDSRT